MRNRHKNKIASYVLLMQVLFPVTAAFTPLMTGATAEKNHYKLDTQQTRIHTMSSGETVSSVASHYGITVDELRRLNQFRAFAHGFDNLRPGDELDVPVSVKPALQHVPEADLTRDREQSQRLAAVTSQAGSMLTGSNTSHVAESMARSLASGAANDAVQSWLGNYGTARASLSVNDRGGLSGSSLDWLVPLYDSPQDMLFIQTGVRNKDSRNTVNLGWGVRWFSPSWMYGFNNFLDNDLTGNNRRVGLGGEARTDYLQFSGNTYLRLSDWHQSRDFSDYDERPANGFDIRAQGWLPAYPQLGGKLMYEQYYGNEVALFGNDNRQRNPYAVTAGLNWTPFPLLTLGVDERLGKNGKNETSLNLQLTWRPGDSLQSQLYSDSARSPRLLETSRYDLVDRNNDIVLEYRKQQPVSVTVDTTTISAPGGSTYMLPVTVHSAHGTPVIRIESAAFAAAGGRVTPVDISHFRLKMPAYQTTQRAQATKRGQADTVSGSNTWILTVTAEDSRGEVSAPVPVTVNVLPPELSVEGELQTSNADAPADGHTAVTVSAVIGDSNGHTVTDQQVTFITTYADGSQDTQTAVTDTNGKVSLDVTSSVAGATTITLIAGETKKSVIVHFSETEISLPHTALNVLPPMIVADGITTAKFTLQARDSNGYPVTGRAAVLSLVSTGEPAVSLTGFTESPAGSGDYTAQVRGTRAGVVTVTALLNGTPLAGMRGTLTLSADGSTAGITSMTTDSDNAVASGTDTNRVKATVEDANGNPVAGVTVNFRADNGATLSPVSATGEDGTVTVTLTSTKAGPVNVTADFNGHNATTVTHFRADNSSLVFGKPVITGNNAAADGSTGIDISWTVTDAGGNPLANQDVTVSTDNGARPDVSVLVTDDSGRAHVSVTSTRAGSASVTATAGDRVSQANVRFTADPKTAHITDGNMKTVSDSAGADGVMTNRVKVIVTDANGNLVPGAVVRFSAGSDTVIAGTGTTGEDGSVTQTLTSTRAGQTLVTASLNESSCSVTLTFTADTATATLADLREGKASAVADGSDSNSVKATVKDAHNNPVAGVTVYFEADNKAAVIAETGVTGSDGVVTQTLTSTKAGDINVTARVKDSSRKVTVSFTADTSNAGVDPSVNPGSSLVTKLDNQVADGIAENVVKATVTDRNGNPTGGVLVSFSVQPGATVKVSQGATGSDGTAVASVVSQKAGTYTVTVKSGGTETTTQVTFVPDQSTAGLDVNLNPGSSLTATGGAKADDIATNDVTATVTDRYGNPVPHISVDFTTDEGAAVVTERDITDTSGVARTTVKATKAGEHTVKASANNSSVTAITTFVGDYGTAGFKGSPVVVGDGAPASGKDPVYVTFKVTDAHDNPLAGQRMNITSAGLSMSLITDSQGGVKVAVTGTAVGTISVKAEVNGKDQTQKVTFVDPIAKTTLSGKTDGVTEVGTPLKAEYTCVMSCPEDVALQWKRQKKSETGSAANWEDIAGATTNSYTPGKDDQKYNIGVIISPVDKGVSIRQVTQEQANG
ncbi:LysM peptidoglycan-binding domain-containing protein [Salmonella enterica]|nr:LysM peptidoglycan-binding domain-containing protein [Salmonella enterica]EKB7612290.1 Ig-like domain-containing protein [Salmonella enterica]